MDQSLVLVFVFLAVVAVGSALVFRRRSLGTKLRAGLSVFAVVLLGAGLVRENGLNPGNAALIVIAVLVLGSGVWFLRKSEQENSPVEPAEKL